MGHGPRTRTNPDLFFAKAFLLAQEASAGATGRGLARDSPRPWMCLCACCADSRDVPNYMSRWSAGLNFLWAAVALSTSAAFT